MLFLNFLNIFVFKTVQPMPLRSSLRSSRRSSFRCDGVSKEEPYMIMNVLITVRKVDNAFQHHRSFSRGSDLRSVLTLFSAFRDRDLDRFFERDFSSSFSTSRFLSRPLSRLFDRRRSRSLRDSFAFSGLAAFFSGRLFLRSFSLSFS